MTSGWPPSSTLRLARKLGLKVAEVPVRWINDSNMRVRPAIDSIRTLIDVFRIYEREIRGRYPRSIPATPRKGARSSDPEAQSHQHTLGPDGGCA